MAAVPSATDQISYTDLYARWERGNWRATELDFSADREQWHGAFSELERRAALWNYSLFLHGEDSVADNLSPFIDAAPREEQKYFLATQQADEARHAVFFDRFMREVVDVPGDSIAGALQATRPQLTWGFRKIFERLDRMADELRRDRSKPRLAAAVTLYHVVIEASLAQPGQHFIERYLVERDVLPGFREGMRHVALDEQRHIAFGVKLLADLQREDPECRDAVAELLREVAPYATALFVPPNWDRSYTECFGFTLEEIFAEGTTSFEAKLRAAGLPPEELPGLAYAWDLGPVEQAARAIRLLQANMLGEKLGPVSREPQVMRDHFDSVRRAVLPQADGRPTSIQWDFADAEPWYLRVDNGATHVAQGRIGDPDIVLRCRFEDWVDLSAGRHDPLRLIATGRLRPRGRPASLLRLRKLFG